MKLSECAIATQGLLHGLDSTFNAINTDTRTLQQGDLFVALRGETFDGHAFINDAIALGATAVVVDVFDERCKVPQIVVANTTLALGNIAQKIRAVFTGHLAAITGSCGKTSVKGFLRCIFELAGPTLATAGNFNNHIGVPLTLNQLSGKEKFAVIEMGASGLGEISYLASMAKPTIALVNNVRPAHVEGFGSIEAIAVEKGAIYDAMCKEGTAIINLDDTYASQYLLQTAAKQQIGFSRRVCALNIPYVMAGECKQHLNGSYSFNLIFGEKSQRVNLQVLGEHFISNALAAAACALAAGLSLEQIAAGLQNYAGEKGRMQLVPPFYLEQEATIINDAYNANPGSVRAAIDFLSQQIHTQRILVLGDMGELGAGEAIEHTSMGIYASEQGIDRLIAVGQLAALAAEAFADIKGQENVSVYANLVEATPELSHLLLQKNTILLKGSRSSGVDRLVTMLVNTMKERSLC